MSKLRVHNFAISVDGYGAGPLQSLDNPLGVGGPRLHEWVFATRYGRRMIGKEGGDEGIDERFMVAGDTDIGATISHLHAPIREDPHHRPRRAQELLSSGKARWSWTRVALARQG